MNFLGDSREWQRFFRFATVGFIGAAVDYTVFNFTWHIIGLDPTVSQAVSFIAAVTNNFILNRKWTYPDSRSKPVHTQIGQYLLVNFIGLLIRTPIFDGLGTIFQQMLTGQSLPFGLSPEVVAHNLSLGCGIGVVLFWNFFINRYWTYGDVE